MVDSKLNLTVLLCPVCWRDEHTSVIDKNVQKKDRSICMSTLASGFVFELLNGGIAALLSFGYSDDMCDLLHRAVAVSTDT